MPSVVAHSGPVMSRTCAAVVRQGEQDVKTSLTRKLGVGVVAGLLIGASGISTGAFAAPGEPTIDDGIKWSQGFSLSYDVAVTRSGHIFFGYSTLSATTAVTIKRYSGAGDLTRTIGVSEPGVSVGLVDVEAVGNRVYVVMQSLGSKGYFVQRMNSAGDLDTAWGGDGEIEVTAMTEAEVAPAAVQAMPDGGLAIVAGDKVYMFAPNGSLDETFSGDGIATVPMPAGAQVYDMAASANGSLVFVGAKGQGARGFVSRLSAVGKVVTNFGNNGVARRGYPNAVVGTLTDVEIDSEGRIVVGTTYRLGESTPTRLGAGRLLANGRTDTSFSQDGWASYSLDTGAMMGVAIAVQPNDKVVVAGGAGTLWSVLRLRENGARDASFGSGGIVTLDGGEEPSAFVLEAEIDKRNDQIVMVGASPLMDAEDAIGLGGLSMS
jgi:uncharacterized delta-60 repeat protein